MKPIPMPLGMIPAYAGIGNLHKTNNHKCRSPTGFFQSQYFQLVITKQPDSTKILFFG